MTEDHQDRRRPENIVFKETSTNSERQPDTSIVVPYLSSVVIRREIMVLLLALKDSRVADTSVQILFGSRRGHL